MNRLSLRVKIIIGLVGIVALIEAALLFVVYDRFSTVMDNELVTTGIAIAGDVATNSAQLIPTDNIFALDSLVKNTLANNPDVRYVIVLDVNNNVLVHSFEQGVPTSLLQANSYVSGQRYNLAILETNEGVIRDLAVPVSEGRWGTIRLGLSDARQQGILATTTNLIMVVTIGLLIAAAAGIYLISNTLVIRPLEKLGQVAQAISQGDLSQKAIITTGDELGLLAETFNQMAARLREVGVDQAAGFALNISNFNTDDSCVTYGTEVSRQLGGRTHFVVDSSRNGLGPAPDGEWCNPPDRALGRDPTTDTATPLVDGFLFIKRPGESDGTCNGGPRAGTWWPEYALGLVRRRPVHQP